MKNRIFFVCVHNAGRSQMAKAFFNKLVPEDSNWYAESAGTEPSENINPIVVEALNELLIDITREKPHKLDFSKITNKDRLISMGCNIHESCPITFRDAIEDWDLEDPHNQGIEKIREIRDIIKLKVVALIQELSKSN
ncbi:MAG: arsenate reductase ArsC [Dehalococcoidia bacterium]